MSIFQINSFIIYSELSLVRHFSLFHLTPEPTFSRETGQSKASLKVRSFNCHATHAYWVARFFVSLIKPNGRVSFFCHCIKIIGLGHKFSSQFKTSLVTSLIFVTLEKLSGQVTYSCHCTQARRSGHLFCCFA